VAAAAVSVGAAAAVAGAAAAGKVENHSRWFSFHPSEYALRPTQGLRRQAPQSLAPTPVLPTERS